MSEQKQKGITRETLKFVFKTAWKERPSVFLVYLMKFISEFASKMQNAIMAKLIIDELVLMITGAEFAQHLANAAIFAGLLFPFLPFHFASGESDLFLSAYFLIPFAILMAFYIEA